MTSLAAAWSKTFEKNKKRKKKSKKIKNSGDFVIKIEKYSKI